MTSEHARGASWENWPKDMSDFNRYSTLTIRLAYALAESTVPELSNNRSIGIVLVSRKVLENALDPDHFKAPNGPPDDLSPLDHTIFQWIADDACIAQTNRSTTLFQNKRHNVVSNIPPVIIAYDPARLCFWEDFDANKPPRESFSFAGAIWSKPRKRKMRTISKSSPTAAMPSYAGSTNGNGNDARFWNPQGLTVDDKGNIYVADTGNNTVRKITPMGMVTTLAGLAGASGTTDGIGADARFNSPGGAAMNNAGNVYVADTNNHAVRKIALPQAAPTCCNDCRAVENGIHPDSRQERDFLPVWRVF